MNILHDSNVLKISYFSTNHDFVYLCFHLLTFVYLCLPLLNFVYICLPSFTFVYLCLPLFKWRIYAQILCLLSLLLFFFSVTIIKNKIQNWRPYFLNKYFPFNKIRKFETVQSVFLISNRALAFQTFEVHLYRFWKLLFVILVRILQTFFLVIKIIPFIR